MVPDRMASLSPERRYDVYLWLLRINRAYYTRLFARRYNPSGVDLFAEDWDTLAILDACRYDTFAAAADLPGRLERRESRSSATIEFLHANFADRDLTDTVYVTASPQLHRFADEVGVTFHDTVDVWADDENWWSADDGREVVLPETTTEYALSAAEAYPNKRLLVHYTQPHVPFIDPTTDALATDGNPFREYVQGTLDASAVELRASYRRNLERALPHVRRLIESVAGRTVVTSDHGQMFGERSFPLPIPVWGHPHGIYTAELVTLPWHVHDSGQRREIVAEPPAGETTAVDRDVVEKRLRDLGYVD